MTLNPHQYLEFLLFSIKGETRKYGAKRKKNLIGKLEQLEAELFELKGITDMAKKHTVQTGHTFTPEQEKEIVEALAAASAKSKEKETLEAHINQGAYVRTGQHWKCESEQGSKLFFQQEKWRGEQRYLGVLEIDAGKGDGSTKLIESQPEIEDEIHKFYKELYKKRPAATSRESIKNFMGEGFSEFFLSLHLLVALLLLSWLALHGEQGCGNGAIGLLLGEGMAGDVGSAATEGLVRQAERHLSLAGLVTIDVGSDRHVRSLTTGCGPD